MPFTPYHFGPGLALAGASRRVSFVAFAAANVVIDLESGWNLVRQQVPIHRFLHGFLGATLAIVPAALLALLACRIAVRAALLPSAPRAPALLLGAALGAWSHVVLDAIMHADVRPLAPWSDRNPLLSAISLAGLHDGCLIAGALGAALFALRAVLARRRPPAAAETSG